MTAAAARLEARRALAEWRAPGGLAPAIVLSWAALVLVSAPGASSNGSAMSVMWWCTASGRGTPLAPFGFSASVEEQLPMWALMCCAMMLPAAAPAVRHVARASLERRRGRACTSFLTGYLGLWIASGALLVPASALIGKLPGYGALALVLLLAGAWELTPLKRRALRACHKSYPIPLWGARATAASFAFGVRNGIACLCSCWPVMLLAAAQAAASLVWMAGLTVIVSIEKSTRRPVYVSSRVGLAALTAAGVLTFVGS